MDVLLVTWDGGGNLPPALGLGRELCRRGHRVRCLGPQGIQAAVERAGLLFRPLAQATAFDPLVPLPLAESQQAQGRDMFGPGYAADLRTEVARERPDVVVIDCFLAAAQGAAEALGVPFVLLVHTLPGWFLPFWDQVLLPPTNASRIGAGLAPVDSTAALWVRAKRVLVASTPLLDTPAPGQSPPGLRYVGPIFEPDAEEPAATEALPNAPEPLVLVSFSTTAMAQGDPLARVIEALRGLPVRALVTTGPAVDPAALPVAPNVTLRRWIPHVAVLPRAALVITHAGHSTVAKSLAHGIPLLCLPMGRDQGFIAQRVQDLGAGRTVPPDATPSAIAGAIALVVEDHAYRDAAQRIAAAIQAVGPGAENAAAELEALGAPA